MYNFEFHRPTGLRQASNMLGKLEEAKILAGGQTLIPTMKLRLASPNNLIDLNAIAEELSGIELRGRSIVIGAMTRHADVANSQVVKDNIPALAYLAGLIGDPAVRHRGTLGGSIANNDPNSDYPAACVGLGATIHTTKGKHEADAFFKGLFETVLAPDEIITKVSFPLAKKAGYEKFRNQASRFALVGVFVVQARFGNPRRGDRRGLERRVPRAELRGGAEEALLAEVARWPDHPGRWHECRHPRQRRIPRASRRRHGAPCGRAGERFFGRRERLYAGQRAGQCHSACISVSCRALAAAASERHDKLAMRKKIA